MKQPFLTNSIYVNDSDTRIEQHQDGSLVFSDKYIQGVRLIDLFQNQLISGGNVVLNPAYKFIVTPTDWTYDNSENVYKIQLYHYWNLIDPELVLVLVYSLNNIQISVQSVQCFTNYILVKNTNALHCKFIVKRI